MTKPAIWFPIIKANTGVDRFTLSLADALHRHGIRTEITWLPHYAEYLPYLISKIRPPEWANIIHINSWLHYRFYAHFGLPVVVTCHGCVHDPALVPYKTLAQKIYHHLWIKPLEKYAFHHAHTITAVSQYTAEITCKNFNSPYIITIPNWLPNAAFNYPKHRKKPHHPFKLLFLGRLSTRKGADLLPLIMKALGNNFELYYTVHPRDKINRNDYPNNMKALGWSSNPEQIKTWIDEADTLLFPSRMEGMPLAVLESMARGLPIICSDSSSLPEIVISGVNGIICQTNNIDEYIKAILILYKDTEKWISFSKNAYHYMHMHYTEKQIIEKYINLYISIIL
ncbi:hypothetical protein B9T29_03215 [Acinetobacter sp. ANC 3903]|uniref:glycosyltransferase family 4 protein n=1 Tax=Acinetobacter sp. ANC 3903 TaxID=1977883 RepID=UPI000A341D27|nr:glycosyltransferase family 4 protein [Acinetobacter sp. ANC 3903]OTG63731.1 hypothetical protein B9T29_03215 [Acinetobacter sp. ANC 3903]